MTAKILYNEQWENAEKNAGRIIADSLVKLAKDKEKIVLGIVGGRSVPGIFRFLASQKEVPWNKTHIFMVDERIVPITHKDSNFKLAKESFLDILVEENILPKENVHPFLMDDKQKDYGASNYSKELKSFGGKFDIVILSSGEDGHIGALYPKHHSIKNDSTWFITMDDSPKPPAKRMTASRKLLQMSNTSVIMFLGEGKKQALERYNNAHKDLISCPAKIVNYIDNAYVLTDIQL